MKKAIIIFVCILGICPIDNYCQTEFTIQIFPANGNLFLEIKIDDFEISYNSRGKNNSSLGIGWGTKFDHSLFVFNGNVYIDEFSNGERRKYISEYLNLLPSIDSYIELFDRKFTEFVSPVEVIRFADLISNDDSLMYEYQKRVWEPFVKNLKDNPPYRISDSSTFLLNGIEDSSRIQKIENGFLRYFLSDKNRIDTFDQMGVLQTKGISKKAGYLDEISSKSGKIRFVFAQNKYFNSSKLQQILLDDKPVYEFEYDYYNNLKVFKYYNCTKSFVAKFSYFSEGPNLHQIKSAEIGADYNQEVAYSQEISEPRKVRVVSETGSQKEEIERDFLSLDTHFSMKLFLNSSSPCEDKLTLKYWGRGKKERIIEKSISLRMEQEK